MNHLKTIFLRNTYVSTTCIGQDCFLRHLVPQFSNLRRVSFISHLGKRRVCAGVLFQDKKAVNNPDEIKLEIKL